jgi:hypothetical protein
MEPKDVNQAGPAGAADGGQPGGSGRNARTTPPAASQSERGGFWGTLTSLPGIKGYQQKEQRRAADKQLRDALSQRLEEERKRLTALQQELLTSGGLLWLDDVERAGSRIQLLADRVRTAAYGYAPFFDLQQIKEKELDRLADFDRALFDAMPGLDQAITAVADAVRDNLQLKESLRTVMELAAEMNDTFGRRAEALRAIQ